MQNRFIVEKQRDIQKLQSKLIGKKKRRILVLNWIEALYLNEVKNYSFLIPDSVLRKLKQYLVYRDLRLRSLFPVFNEIRGDKKPLKFYKGKNLSLNSCKIEKYSLSSDGFVIVRDHPKEVKELYEKNWFGQLGIYKSKNKGKFYLLDRFEAYYLFKKNILKLNLKDVERIRNFRNFEDYFSVYYSWRENGFVVKTGFKFGADFRIYFPGISPSNFEHSKHVLHVFPRGFNMRVEELSRAIRVANSVKKTFILAVPIHKRKSLSPDFYVLDRNKSPIYSVKTFSQEEKVSSIKLSSLLSKTISMGLNMLISIADRESAVTYYEVKKISIPSSSFDFYEVKWVNP